jgi:hypothetical protein
MFSNNPSNFLLNCWFKTSSGSKYTKKLLCLSTSSICFNST